MQDPGGDLPVNSMLVPCNRPLAGRRVRSHPTQVLKCPRCDSLNTKFCYYNNYNLSQPRHFCKNCRRYWTKGGVLRNVPVGGGCRKNKRSKAPRNPDHRGSPRKCASNSTTVSSENSTVTVAVQEASSASNSGVKIPDGESLESFDQETLVQQILSMPDPLRLEDAVNCDALTYGSGPENAIPRLLSGLASLDYGLLDWQIPAQSLTNLGNLLSDGTNSNSNPYGSLVNSSSPAGLSFSDLQWMLLQQPKMEELCPEGRCINSNNNNNAAASEWQPNYHSEVLYEMPNDFCGWGMPGISASDQKPLRLP